RFREGEEERVHRRQVSVVESLEVGLDYPRALLSRLLEPASQQRGFPHLPRAFDEHDAVLPRQRRRELRISRPLNVERRSQRHRTADGLKPGWEIANCK